MKTRLAPTPSGFLHLGNALSFALTKRIAQRYGAGVLLRIDDMDRDRVSEEYVRDIFDTLQYLGIDWDEGPKNLEDYKAAYAQIHRMSLYEQALQKLRPRLYACVCSRAQLQQRACACKDKHIPLETNDVNWRIATDDRVLTVKEASHGDGVRAALPEDMRDFVVRKKDGFPAYQLTSVIDDLHFKTTIIVRGEDLWNSTLAQLYLAQTLNEPHFENITFFHHPLLTDSAGHKLSKSAGSTSIQSMRKKGVPADKVYDRIHGMLEGILRTVR